MNQDILDRNLLALSRTSSEAAARISAAECWKGIDVESSRKGDPVPVLRTDQGDRTLHSRFDPVREGLRLADNYIGSGTILAYGMGAGYHLLPLLSNKDLSSLIIAETRPSLVRSILEQIDLTPLFLDKRVSLWICIDPAEFRIKLLKHYIPVLSGDFRSISLRNRIEADLDFYQELSSVVKDALSSITDDYTVQTHFGKKWFNNTLSNLKASEETTVTLHPAHDVLITAAGPSLEKQLDKLVSMRSGATLIATDTSLPVLLSNNIKPDMVISIDCQHISYHHFMKGYPSDVPLILDLASPPFLTRIAEKVFFFTSDHPFSNYVSRSFRQFPHLDTSGGNVTHSALSLADALGASRISLFGTDFSYPMGKPYARGSYIYPYFQKSTVRTAGIESLFMDFVLHNKSIIKEKTHKGFRYISKPMIHYKRSLEAKSSSISARVVSIPGDGVTLDLPSLKGKRNDGFMLMSAGSSINSRIDFMKEYRGAVSTLPIIDAAITEYLDSLDRGQMDILITLLPAAAQFRKSCDSGREALNRAREWTISLLDRSFSQQQ